MGKGLFGFCLFSGDGEFHGSGDLGNLVFKGGSFIEWVRATVDNLVENLVIISVREELGFFLPTIVLEKL